MVLEGFTCIRERGEPRS